MKKYTAIFITLSALLFSAVTPLIAAEEEEVLIGTFKALEQQGKRWEITIDDKQYHVAYNAEIALPEGYKFPYIDEFKGTTCRFQLNPTNPYQLIYLACPR